MCECSGVKCPQLAGYPFVLPIQSRWMDNDMYGHVNNVQYYSYMDTVINTYLIQAGVLEPHTSPVIGLCISSSCSYMAPMSFPNVIRTLHADTTVSRLSLTCVCVHVCVSVCVCVYVCVCGCMGLRCDQTRRTNS